MRIGLLTQYYKPEMGAPQNRHWLFANEITLPLNTRMSDDDLEYVIACFRECLGKE